MKIGSIARFTKKLIHNAGLLAHAIIDHKISLKELYFSLSTWFLLLICFLGFATKFYTTLWVTNIIIALFVYFLILLTTNRLLLSGFTTLLLAVSFDYIKTIKWQFLMQEFSAADFFMVQLLINHGLIRLIYEYATKEIYLIIILLAINFILLWNKSDRLLDKKDLTLKHYCSLRLLSVGLALLLSMKFLDLTSNRTSYVSMLINNIKSDYEKYPHKFYGPFADVIFTMQDLYIHPKAGSVDSKLVKSLVNNGYIKNQAINNSDEMPDIIVILNESVFDPNNLDYDFAQKLDFKFFQTNQYTKQYGTLNVHTFGGSSWISEYEANTGIAHRSFAGPSYMPFITLAPITQNSIMRYLRSMGYRVEVIYPVDKNFSLAKEAYTTLGANRIQDVYELGFKPKTWANVPDSVIGDMILDVLNQNPEKPKYIFASTMVNHGPHSSFFKDHIGCSMKMHDMLCSKLNDYMSRLRQTDEEQMDLINKLMKRKRKTIIVNFGDHMPSFEGFSPQLRFMRKIEDYYKTFYHVYANFEPKDPQGNYPILDITFIPGLVLDIAGLNQDNFYRANSLIRRKCSGVLDKCKIGAGEQQILESYKTLMTEQLELPKETP
jgi:phosphoglycerol transferase MdoB-like AlkP superfamily enzyme